MAMSMHQSVGRVFPLLLAVLMLGCAARAPSPAAEPQRALPADGRVEVSWEDPARFTERFRSQGRPGWEDRERSALRLAEHLRKSVSERLPSGSTAHIHVLDLALAGSYEAPLGMPAVDVRILRDNYPPMIELSLRRDGQADAQTHRLSDVGYLGKSQVRYPRDPLRHEKRMIDDWVAREFGAGRP